MAEKPAPEQDPATGRFVSGNIGGGRFKGARAKLGEAFIQAMQDDFAEHGVTAIETVRADRPHEYLKIIASILPKDMNINVNNMDGATDDEIIQRIRDLDAVIRPFLAPEGEAGISAGTGPATTH